MTAATMRLQHFILKAEVEEFLYNEAELLDQRRFGDWLDLLADDIVYYMPLRRSVPSNDLTRLENTQQGRQISWFDEDKWTLSKRVDQLNTGYHWAEVPSSRIRHMVSNVQVFDASPTPEDPVEVSARSRFLIYQNRSEAENYTLIGKRTDRLRKENGAWKIARREIILDQDILLAKVLTMFF